MLTDRTLKVGDIISDIESLEHLYQILDAGYVLGTPVPDGNGYKLYADPSRSGRDRYRYDGISNAVRDPVFSGDEEFPYVVLEAPPFVDFQELRDAL